MPDRARFRELDPTLVVERVADLRIRVEERFPERRLVRVCGELEGIARDTADHLEAIQRPMTWLRVLVGSVLVLLLVAGWATITSLGVRADEELTAGDLVQILDGLTNEVILAGAATIFLVRTERRVKRRRTLQALHELRSIAHVIDTHQLDKDPDRILGGAPPTAHSPRDELTLSEVVRYLNYCSMMFALIGKLAALYVERFEDDVAVAAVNEVEELCMGLSRKVWQKIMIIHQDPRYLDQVSGRVAPS